jgi:bifunctional non-homologous end joining protein LigD
MKSIALYLKEGSSDKEYHISIQPKGDLFVVNTLHGRRGTSLIPGSLTNKGPVSFPAAEKLFEAKVKTQKGKGYTGDESGKTFLDTDSKNTDSGIRCQLLNAIDEAEAERLIADEDYFLEEKHDGRRLLIRKVGKTLTGVNKKGLEVALASEYSSLASLPDDFIIDTEDMGSHAFVFDILELNGADLRAKSALERFQILRKFFAKIFLPEIKLTEAAFTVTEKRALFDLLKLRKVEGIVFKLKSSLYTQGRPASGGSQLKYKFYETASFVVAKLNAKRSVLLSLFNELGKSVQAGNVTIPANYEIPSVGDVVEVKYLYAYKQSGSVFQPSYLGKRSDVDPDECLTKQLKYKATGDEDEA